MDWKLALTAFTTVFLAELGDKTQIATLAMASGAGSKLAVFAGAAIALVATSAVAVLGASAITSFVPAIWLRRAAGALFLVLGVIYLLSSGED